MTLTADASARGPLGIATLGPTDRSPYWHRDDPVVAVTHVDPGHDRLRRQFPDTWRPLMRAKALLDGTAAVEAPGATSAALHRERIAPLLRAAAGELRHFADVERRPASQDVREQAATAAVRLLGYVTTGRWTTRVLTPPRPGRPWLYCGPLHTWAAHSAHQPLGLLLVQPRPDLQVAPDYVDTRLRLVRSAVADALGGPVVATPPQRSMRIGDVLLAGGESVLGHKHSAHLFPLETPFCTTEDHDFTIVFGNVQAERLQRCSLPLLRRYLGRPADWCAAVGLLPVSIQWFRGQDLAHFWRLRSLDGTGRALGSLTPFERIMLEEAYADTLGLLSTAAVVRHGPLGYAFAAEMLRHLSRDHRQFATSGAAVLMLGWLRQRGRSLRSDGGEWLTGSLPALAELARVLHGLRWEGGDLGLNLVTSALADGERLLTAEIEPLFRTVPTDLDYTFG